MALRFSVIIPTFERPRALSECLEHLAAQNFPKHRFEIIVVDDGGECDLQWLTDSIDANPCLLHQANQGPAAARNRGARAATADILVFTDDDCLPDPHWLSELDKVCRPDVLVAGHTVNFFPQNLYSQTTQDVIDFLYAHQRRASANIMVVASNNMAVHREVYLSAGGFDERFDIAGGEDRDLADRLIRGSLRLKYSNAVVRHAAWLTASDFVKQHYRYGKGAYLFHRLHRVREGNPASFESPRFYCRLLFSPLRTQGIRGLPTFLWMVVSQLAHSAGYLRAKYRGQIPSHEPAYRRTTASSETIEP